MGRQPDNSAAKKLKGNKRKNMGGLVEYIPPVCPDWLPDDAKTVWERKSPPLMQLKKLSISNEDEFAEYCNLIVTLRRINLFIEKENASMIQITEWTDNRTGEVQEKWAESPYSKMRRDYLTKLRSFEKQFGIKPSEIGSSDENGDDEDMFV